MATGGKAIGVVACCLAAGAAGVLTAALAASDATEPEPSIPPPAIVDAVSGLHGASLEMRENVDFLLTPALLVQEAVSPGLLTTYPNE